jgi:Domain of unknown function (DUF5103)
MKNKNNQYFTGICFGLFLFFCGFASSAQKFKPENMVYDPNFRTVLLYPLINMPKTPQEMLNPPVIGLQNDTPLLLEFDYLKSDFQNLRAKIFHYNADWTPSVLNEIEFLTESNDFPIRDYQNSFATKIPYFHFTFEIPRTKVSGNFIVMVYKNRDEEDVVLTHRFMVNDGRVSTGGNVKFANNPEKRYQYQEVNIGINYAGYEVINPKEDFNIIVRQNFRESKTIRNLKPFMVNEFDKKLEFRYFNNENLMLGGNEFRMFDARSTQQRLFNISDTKQGERESILILRYDKPQNGLTYVDTKDFNGMFVIDNYETNRGSTDADYVQVNFQLRMDEIEDKKVYVNGGFNNWVLNEKNLMKYVSENKAYEATIQLKQGIYNFNYVTKNSRGEVSDTELEGSHAQTENNYEIFIYHRPIGSRADALVGYSLIKSR